MIVALLSYLPSLLLTLAVECALVAAAAPRPLRKAAVTACLALNLFTHPLATLLSWYWVPGLVELELLVFFVEWLGYALLLRLHVASALRYALLPNLLSAVLGFCLALAGIL